MFGCVGVGVGIVLVGFVVVGFVTLGVCEVALPPIMEMHA
jgi:hypothetical protein